MHCCRFKNGSTNCIVATDVVDEGIDIPTCTLIIRYDMPTDFRGYVQSKGRARHSLSNYVILMPMDDCDFLRKYQQYKSTESKLKGVSCSIKKSITYKINNYRTIHWWWKKS